MKLIKNMILIDLRNAEKDYMLINSLYGNINIINNNETKILKKWIDNENIIIENDSEKDFYKQLEEKKFLTENYQYENDEKDKIIKSLDKYQKKICKKNDIALLLSYNCNFACPYCYEHKNIKEKSSYNIMTKEMVDKIFELNNYNINSIMFYGGEPFLPSNIEIIKYVIQKKPHIKYTAFTNGYYLEEFHSILSQVNVSFLQVTLDGEKKIHNKTRILKSGKPTYDKIMKGVELFLKRGTEIRFRMNLNNDNTESCLKLRNILLENFEEYKNLISFELQPVFQLDPQKKTEIHKKLYNADILCDNALSPAKMNRMYTSEIPIINHILLGNKIRPKYTFCNACDTSKFYDPNGNIYSCILSVGQSYKAIGKYYPDYTINPKSIINRNITMIDECSKCKYSLLCGGGCPNPIIDDNGNSFYPNCSSIKDALYNKIPYIYEMMINE